MNNSQKWIQGGPLLEVSFLQPADINILYVVNTLSKLSYKLEIVLSEEDINKSINDFNEGYLFDETDINSRRLHSLKLPLYLDISGKRKAILHIEKLSDTLSIVDIYFYGSEHNAIEWNQTGISKDQIENFKKFLDDIFEEINFPIGIVEFEENVLGVFKTTNCLPNKEFNLDNIDENKLKNIYYKIINHN